MSAAMRTPAAAAQARQLGLSLVEIMVAVAIGMIGILIITQAYITSDNFNRATLGEGGAQTNGLIALFTVERDARQAGFGIASSAALGCGQIYWYYNPKYSSNVAGHEADGLPTLTLAPVLITMSTTSAVVTEPAKVTVMYATSAERMMPTEISTFNAAAAQIAVDGAAGFKSGHTVLLVGSTGCTLRTLSTDPASTTLTFGSGALTPMNPAAWGAFPTTYALGDAVLNLGSPVVREYSITSGKLRLTDLIAQAAGTAGQDLVDGIVDLRAQYGHDSNSDGKVDTWNSITPATSADWGKVLAFRMAVLARIGNFEKPSVSGGDCDATSAAPTWSGSAIDGGAFAKLSFAALSQDRCYRYRVFETTVPLRNMIWRSI